MKTLLLAALAAVFACAASGVQARSLVLEETSRFQNPDPSHYESFPTAVGIDGDDAFVAMSHYIPAPSDEYYDEQQLEVAVWLFRRINGTWTPVRQIAFNHFSYYSEWDHSISMKDGIAAVNFGGGIAIFERTNGEWVQKNSVWPGPGGEVEVDGGRIISGGSDCQWKGTLFARDAAGVWRETSTMFGEERGCDDEFSGGPVALSGGHALVLNRYNDTTSYERMPSVFLFRDWGGTSGFQFAGSVYNSTFTPLGYAIALRGDEAFIAGSDATGTHVFRNSNTGSWDRVDSLLPLDAHMGAGRTSYVRKSELYVMTHAWSSDRLGSVIHVFTKGTDGQYRQAATLAASSNTSVGRFAISGRRVIASCGGEACVFELPATLTEPTSLQDTFAGSTPAGWTPSAGSQFAIAQSGVSRVLRQSETASTATHAALLTAANWSNEAIEADIRATAFSGNDRWFGLATRYRDASNYYYVTLRSSGTVSLRRLVNGAFATLASAPLPVALNRTYRVRLQSIGSRHVVYVNGAPLLDADDRTHASGRVALLTYRTAAEFDNVVASQTPAVSLYASDFEPYSPRGAPFEGVFQFNAAGLWSLELRGDVPNNYVRQTAVGGDARAFVGVPTDAQSVSARVRPTTFAGTGNGERWVGIMARYADSSNYYYLSVRSGNSVSLRKLTHGSVATLGSAPLAVSVGTWYALRLDAVGNQIRAYVNGELVIEATDNTHARGSAGFVTYRAAADFDDLHVVQP
jgi:hypothetical protein